MREDSYHWRESLDLRIEGVRESLERLIPGAEAIVRQHKEPPSAATKYLYEGPSGSLGITAVKPAFEFWVSLHDSGTWCFSISRPSLAFSTSERKFFGSLPSVLAGLLVASEGPGNKRVHHRLGGQLSFEHLLVAQVLRRQRGGGLWTPLLIMQALIADSGAFRPLIPIDSGRAFQSIPATDSRAFRPDIPADFGHPEQATAR